MSERIDLPTIQSQPQPLPKRGMTIRRLHYITSNMPSQYKDLLGALHVVDTQVPEKSREMSGDKAIRSAEHIGDEGRTIDVEVTIPLLEDGPYQTKNGGIILGRPGLEEAIFVNPSTPTSLNEIVEEITSPQTTSQVNPPFPAQPWNVVEGDVTAAPISTVNQSEIVSTQSKPIESENNQVFGSYGTKPTNPIFGSNESIQQSQSPQEQPQSNPFMGILTPEQLDRAKNKDSQ